MHLSSSNSNNQGDTPRAHKYGEKMLKLISTTKNDPLSIDLSTPSFGGFKAKSRVKKERRLGRLLTSKIRLILGDKPYRRTEEDNISNNTGVLELTFSKNRRNCDLQGIQEIHSESPLKYRNKAEESPEGISAFNLSITNPLLSFCKPTTKGPKRVFNSKLIKDEQTHSPEYSQEDRKEGVRINIGQPQMLVRTKTSVAKRGGLNVLNMLNILNIRRNGINEDKREKYQNSEKLCPFKFPILHRRYKSANRCLPPPDSTDSTQHSNPPKLMDLAYLPPQNTSNNNSSPRNYEIGPRYMNCASTPRSSKAQNINPKDLEEGRKYIHIPNKINHGSQYQYQYKRKYYIEQPGGKENKGIRRNKENISPDQTIRVYRGRRLIWNGAENRYKGLGVKLPNHMKYYYDPFYERHNHNNH